MLLSASIRFTRFLSLCLLIIPLLGAPGMGQQSAPIPGFFLGTSSGTAARKSGDRASAGLFCAAFGLSEISAAL